MYIPYELIAKALAASSFPDSVREFLSIDYLLRVGRQRATTLPYIRSGSQRTEPLWNALSVQRYIWRKYSKGAPREATAFGIALNELVAQEKINRANDRDRQAAAKATK